MHMYIAMIFAATAMFFWPEKNIIEIPFAALTLKLIFSTIFALYLSYCSLKFAFHSFVEDKFWPWRWNKRVLTLLAMRGGWLALIAFGAWAITEHKKFGELAGNYPIIFLVIIFIATSSAICMPDETFLAPSPEKQNDHPI